MSSNTSVNQKHQSCDFDGSLDQTFDKMQKLGIPADIFGNINPKWRNVMRNYFDQDKQVDLNVEQEFQKVIQKLERRCQSKYDGNFEKIQDCQQQAELRIVNQFSKPKQLSEILLCNFANKCLLRGDSVQFCSQQVMKEKRVINRECLKKLQAIEEYL